MGEVIKVGMADLKTAKAPNTLTTLGLGSCIGLTLYDPVTKIGGLVHYMLPDSTKLKNNTNIAKFGDTGIRELLRQVLALGANQRRLVAKIAGGACMFEMSGLSSVGNVGARNAEEAKIILKELRIPLIAEDTGLNYGRTVELDCETGDFRIKSVGKEIKSNIEGQKMKTNGVPAIIMLAAGFIDCVIAILTHMSLWNFTRQLLLVLVLFYVIGCVVKMIIDRNFKDMEDDQNGEETEESKEEQEAESSEEQENTEQAKDAQEQSQEQPEVQEEQQTK